MEDNYLYKHFIDNPGNGICKWAHYFEIYEKHLSKFRNKSPTILEIGVFDGGSLKMWSDYFGPGSTVIGLDINPHCKQYEGGNVEVFIGSQDSPDLIKEVLTIHTDIDIVIDDGSHQMRHMVDSFNLLYNHMNPNGVYIVEDTHTCYWSEYEAGLKKQGTFMEFAKDKMDEINAIHTRGALPINSFTRSTNSITCYDSVVVFERKPQRDRRSFTSHSITTYPMH